jgi:hypothetical protein
MLDKMHKEGKLGSQNMSHRYKTDSDGKKEFYSAKSAEDSQNTFIYNRIKDTLL